jgi:hypothetical protein
VLPVVVVEVALERVDEKAVGRREGRGVQVGGVGGDDV